MAGFSSPPNVKAFNEQVWAIVRQIPSGRVLAYGQVAQRIPPPGGMDPKNYLAFGARWVGGAMAACPPDVPWWRVVNAKGEISPRSGADEQQVRLRAEGVVFDERGRIDMKRFSWEAPGEARQESLF
jgi:methylated-DNA-protein-cysteine methyltransferase-like protein